ncbi:hypothetical protein BDV27DRAFT_85318 [Aspergillus caelatus]|uniref:Uncharacterized protein n=1 Tax=Aspergillus caelatus TaxID=61420 RepID=A0A5N7AA80_9EURO|nr:uncharacterized protein BDV27DRAFT_85318 [Aspergillus caelatus]KAE8366791.1 hypothetical protein BDV27DRAFT_85318 [Aspergillus caelatus]
MSNLHVPLHLPPLSARSSTSYPFSRQKFEPEGYMSNPPQGIQELKSAEINNTQVESRMERIQAANT